MSIIEGLIEIQNDLKAPKNQYNSFGKYYYRSAEDILEALKPLLLRYKIQMTTPQTIEHIGNDDYIKTTVVLIDKDGHRNCDNTGYARIDVDKKGMDGAQITGAAGSYSKKYALCNAFLIDDTKDSDTEEYQSQAKRQTKTAPKKRTTTTTAKAEPSEPVASKMSAEADSYPREKKVLDAKRAVIAYEGGDVEAGKEVWMRYTENGTRELSDAELDTILYIGYLS